MGPPAIERSYEPEEEKIRVKDCDYTGVRALLERLTMSDDAETIREANQALKALARIADDD